MKQYFDKDVRVVVVDDEKNICEIFKDALEMQGISCLTFNEGQAVLNHLEASPADVVITDIMMPVMDGLGLTREIKQKYDTDVIVMTGQHYRYSYESIIEIGASDFIHKPVPLEELIIRLKRVLMERHERSARRSAENMLRNKVEELEKSLESTVRVLSSAVELRDPYTAGHQNRVASLAREIGRKMGLSEKDINGLYLASLVHDVGKLHVPIDILSKPTRLSDVEFSLIKTHTEAGYEILKNISFPFPIADIVLQHHERIDGSGYPQGLKGDQITMEARIIAVADVVEAMASHRPYRPAVGVEKAIEEISTYSGKLYESEVAEACVSLFNEGGFKF